MPVDTFHNRNFVRKALTDIGRPGTETLLEMLDNSNFHKADLGRADSGEGSLVNHCLYVLGRYCVVMRIKFIHNSSAGIPSESIYITFQFVFLFTLTVKLFLFRICIL